MAINKNSNGFTFFFAIALVVVFGASLSILKSSLKPIQDKNAAVKKKMDILGAIKVESTRENADVKFEELLKDSYVINAKGEKVADGPSALDVDVKKDFRSKVSRKTKAFKGDPDGLQAALESESELYFPVFVFEQDGQDLTVVPMVGSGLWGPIWGFVSVEDDKKTIYGCKFDHKTETPGLGAEIKEDLFLDRFDPAKEAESSRVLMPGSSKIFEVIKGGAAPTKENQVEGITGGTITSKGVEEMMNRTFSIYYKHFQTGTAQPNR